MDLLAFAALLLVPFFWGARRHRETRPIWHFATGGLLLIVPIVIESVLIAFRVEEHREWLGFGIVFSLWGGIAMLGYALGLNASYREWARAKDR